MPRRPPPEPTEYDLQERRLFTGGIKGGVSTKFEKDKSDVFFQGDITAKVLFSLGMLFIFFISPHLSMTQTLGKTCRNAVSQNQLL